MMTPSQVARLTTEVTGKPCGKRLVQVACQQGRIPGAVKVTVGSMSAWEIPDEAAHEWAAKYVPYAALKQAQCREPSCRLIFATTAARDGHEIAAGHR